MAYLKSVLRQEVGFFDTQEAGSSTTYQVISTLSSDSNSVQVAICEKVLKNKISVVQWKMLLYIPDDYNFDVCYCLSFQIPDCLQHMSNFFFCLLVSFILSWKLALAALPFSVMFIVPCLVFGKLMMDFAVKTIASYSLAGGIAEQAISSIRTVYAYVGEYETLDKFRGALEKTMELGVQMGFAKGLMMGSMGIIYVGWAFQAWVGTILVSEKGEKGGAVFVAGICVIMGGL